MGDEQLERALEALGRYADGDLKRLAAERRNDVVTWRQAAPGTSPHRPEPWFDEKAGKEPDWLAGGDARDGLHVGFDAAGRPVLSELRWAGFGSRLEEVWLHGEGWSDVLTADGPSRILSEDGRVAAVVTTERGGPQVELWTWVGGHPVRSDIAGAYSTYTLVEAYVADLDRDGRLWKLSRAVETQEREDADEWSAVKGALARAAELVPDHVVFDGRVDRLEARLRPSAELVERLGPAVDEAVAAAVVSSGVADPFVVELTLGKRGFPPFARVGGERFRERMTSLSRERDAAIHSLWQARPPDGATVDLADHLDEEALRACRELNRALSSERGYDSPDRVRASEVSALLGREWAARLNGRDWSGVAEPFLALVGIGRQFEDADPFELAAPTVGAARVDAFRQSIASRARRSAKLPAAAAHDRAALRTLFEERGLSECAERITAAAEVGLRLEQAGNDGWSRLGGAGVLPSGEGWPHAAGERPLTFLAGLDLTELPENGELPDSGWLLFFADLDNDEALGLIEPAPNHDGGPARLFFVPPGTPPVEASPPEGLRDVLIERRVVAAPQLTLPDDDDVGDRLGLDPAELSVYEDVAHRLRYGESPSWSGNDHWVLGAVTGVQQNPNEPETVLLLHISWDEALGFEYLDGGAIQFRISEAALRAGDWGAVSVEPDSS